MDLSFVVLLTASVLKWLAGFSDGKKAFVWDNIRFSHWMPDYEPTSKLALSLGQCVETCYDHGVEFVSLSYNRHNYSCYLHKTTGNSSTLEKIAGWVYLPKYGAEGGMCHNTTCPTTHVCHRKLRKCIGPCEVGQYWNTTSEGCLLCDVGYYQDNVNSQYNDVCKQCPIGTATTENGGTQPIDCKDKCNGGEYMDISNGECKKCPVGHFRGEDDMNKTSCLACPQKHSTISEGSTNSEDCLLLGCCAIDHVWSLEDQDCTECPQTEYTVRSLPYTTTCLGCPSGLIKSESGSRQGNIFDCDTRTFMEEPDFISDWTLIPSNMTRLEFNHGLDEVPLMVDVQIKVISDPNEGYIYQGVGEHTTNGNGSGVVYLYTKVKVVLLLPNGFKKIDYSGLYNQRDSEETSVQNRSDLVRVRAWRNSSLPAPRFNTTRTLTVDTGSDQDSPLKIEHSFDKFPAFAVVRIRMSSWIYENITYENVYLDSQGSFYGSATGSSSSGVYLVSGYNKKNVVVWFGTDGSMVNGSTTEETSGELEVYAWIKDFPFRKSKLNTNLTCDDLLEFQETTLPLSVGNSHFLRSSIRVNETRIHGSCPEYISRSCFGGLFYGFKNSSFRFGVPDGLRWHDTVNENFSRRIVTEVWEMVPGRCRGTPCKNGGSCINSRHRYDCVCVWNWTGRNCEEEIMAADRACNVYLVSGPFRVSDCQLNASSAYGDTHEPRFARLNQVETEPGNGAWTVRASDQEPYIQVDFGEPRLVEQVVTQGRDSVKHPNQFVTKYKVSTSMDCVGFDYVQDVNGTTIEFTGNTDMTTVVSNTLPKQEVARCVRLHPTQYSIHMSMRFDLIGCV